MNPFPRPIDALHVAFARSRSMLWVSALTSTGKAVFLSYASEVAVAAEKICAALRSAGIEVWFDKSELRGGDAWDASIRQQIKNCTLFIPVISRTTHARDEGYFRLEWKLAVDPVAPDRRRSRVSAARRDRRYGGCGGEGAITCTLLIRGVNTLQPQRLRSRPPK
jgi:hypothetical protein